MPKLKKDNYDEKIPHSEVVLSQYTKDQIKIYCITDKLMRLSDIFENKREMEQAFDLPCLPIAIFSPGQGKLTVYFEEELNLQWVLLEKNQKLLEHFCISTGIQFEAIPAKREKTKNLP